MTRRSHVWHRIDLLGLEQEEFSLVSTPSLHLKDDEEATTSRHLDDLVATCRSLDDDVTTTREPRDDDVMTTREP